MATLTEGILVDHHAHSVAGEIADRAAFERFLSESGRPAPAGCSHFDTFLGASLLRTCAPVIGLSKTATPDEYLTRRAELGGEAANIWLLRAAGVGAIFVDDGFAGPGFLGLEELAKLAATPVHRVLRLEHVAETLAREGVDAARFADAFAARVASELSGPYAAIGCKSVLAYRHGLDVDPSEPAPAEVSQAAAEWLAPAGESGSLRLTHPVLLRHLVWVGLRAGVPLQFHTGFGDTDLELHRSDPSLLTRLIRAAEPLGTPIVLLHCYPYHRQAAYLAAVYPNVYFDVGLALNYVGHRAPEVLAEALEVAPFHKMLYSSDAYGLAELHLLGAVGFRRALRLALEPLVSREGRSDEELVRTAAMICSGNARRIYGVPDLVARELEPPK